jgi:hypothetical protein
MRITLLTDDLTVTPTNNRKLDLDLDVEVNDLLDQITITEAIYYYGESELLEKIGIDAVKSHFGLTETE